MVGEIPTLWASSLRIFWHLITVGNFPVCVPAGPPRVWRFPERWSLHKFPVRAFHSLSRPLLRTGNCERPSILLAQGFRAESVTSLNHWVKPTLHMALKESLEVVSCITKVLFAFIQGIMLSWIFRGYNYIKKIVILSLWFVSVFVIVESYCEYGWEMLHIPVHLHTEYCP